MATKKTATRRTKSDNGGNSGAKVTRDTLIVDFTGTEGRKGGVHFKPGDYLVRSVSAKPGKSAQKETPQLIVAFQFMDGKYKAKKLEHRFNLLPQSLWVLRNCLDAMGIPIPKSIAKLPLKKLVKKDLAITIDDETYEDDKGKERTVSKIVDFFPADDYEAAGSKEEDEDLGEDEEEDEAEEESDDEDEDEGEDEEEDEDEESDDEEEDEASEDDDELEDLDLDDI